jgi:putative ATP-binding cassette transporter
LNEDEQQTVAFARIVLHAPPWVLIDEVLDSLDEDARRGVIGIFTEDLPRTGVIHIGRADDGEIGRGGGDEPFFARVLHLVKDPAGPKLQVPAAEPAAVDG